MCGLYLKNTLDTPPTTNAPSSRPFSLAARSHNGSITLAIPRTFTGPITLITSRGGSQTSQLSPDVRARAVVFSDVDGRRACFVGDVREYGAFFFCFPFFGYVVLVFLFFLLF